MYGGEDVTIIYSLDIDSMDTTLHEHYRTPEGDRIGYLVACDGDVYFSQDYYNEEAEEYGIIIYKLNTSNDNVEKVLSFANDDVRYFVKNGVLYYDIKSVLHAYDINAGTDTEIINRGEISYFILLDDQILCQSTSGIYLYSYDGTLTDTLYTSEVTGDRMSFTIDDSNNIYFSGYSPEEYERSWPHTGSATNPTGGKIFKLSEGNTELFYSFPTNTIIDSIQAFNSSSGTVLYVEASVEDYNFNYFLYEEDGNIVCYTVPYVDIP